MNERFQIVKGAVVKDNLTGRIYQRSNIAGFLNKLTQKHDADIAEERERTERAAELLREAVDRLVEFADDKHDTWESAIWRKSPFLTEVQEFLNSLPEEASDE